MNGINDILSVMAHRPFKLPLGKWAYYQEWNEALFLHWEISPDIIRELVPPDLHIDTWEGKAYISLVAFTMQKIRPRNLPAIRPISDFDEINVRTYIDNGNKKGVYFLNIEAKKILSAFIAKKLSGLPYEKSKIQRTKNNYRSGNAQKHFYLDVTFQAGSLLSKKTALDRWLTERYCLYLDRAGAIYRYDIHHKEWELKNVELQSLHLNYKIGPLHLIGKPVLAHYSDGVKVLAWQKDRI